MSPEQFWTSQDGQILTVKNKDERIVSLSLAFWPRNPAEFDFMKSRIGELKFTERSSLARIGIEMQILGPLEVDGNRLVLSVEAFVYDMSFPNSPYWKKLLRSGVPVGRLFHAPAGAKLTSDEIWTAIRENRLKLPNTISIDSQGSVFLTPHQVSYTLSPQAPADQLRAHRQRRGGAQLPRQGADPPRRLAAHHPAPLGDTDELLDVPEGALRRPQPGRGQLRHPHERRAPRSR